MDALTVLLRASKIAVSRAAAVALSVQRSVLSSGLLDTLAKEDASPVTIGDFAAQAVVSYLLQKHTRELPSASFRLLAEEDSETLLAASQLLQSHVVAAVNRALRSDCSSDLSIGDIAALIDAGRVSGDVDSLATANGTGGYFILDPIDGTKGFIRRGQWAVGLAFVRDGQPVLAVVAAPNLPAEYTWRGAEVATSPAHVTTPAVAEGGSGSLFSAVAGSGAFMEPLLLSSRTEADGGEGGAAAPAHTGLASSDAARPIRVSATHASANLHYAESFERGHSVGSSTSLVASALGITAEPLRCDSMVKYCMVARGEADLFMRFPPAGYAEKVWDHAPGWLLVREAGGCVTDARGAALDFSRGRTLPPSPGIVACSAAMHPRVLEAVARSGVAALL